MNDPVQRLINEKLRRSGLRVTGPRVAVLLALVQHGGHSSAEEALVLAQAIEPSMTRSTVYRTLERLRDQRLISETDLGDGVRRFEMVDDIPHHHLICTGCGAIIDLDDATVETLRAAIETASGFQADIDHLALFGRCRSCRPAAW